MHSKKSFFREFGEVFSKYRATQLNKWTMIAYLRVPAKGKKNGTPLAHTEIRATARWDISNEMDPASYRVDIIHLDADGDEVARGRGKKASSAENALKELINKIPAGFNPP